MRLKIELKLHRIHSKMLNCSSKQNLQTAPVIIACWDNSELSKDTLFLAQSGYLLRYSKTKEEGKRQTAGGERERM